MKLKGSEVNFRKNLIYFIIYSGLFLLVFLGAYFAFDEYGLSFVQYPDGFHQYYPKMVYIDNFFKEIAANFAKGNFIIPQFDLNIGLGEDVFSIMGTWIMDFPFSVFSQFVKENDFEKVYAFHVIFKMYLAGVTFSYVCIKWEKRRRFILPAALIYVFSGYLMRIGPMHPAFIHIFILFPLAIYGLDKIIRKESPLMFTFAFAMMLMRGYYFAYMATILTFVYGIFRYWEVQQKINLKELTRVILTAAKGYIIALLMGAITILPTIVAFLGSTRSGDGEFENWLYPIEYYAKSLVGLIIPPGDYDAPALVSIVIPFLILPFVKKKRKNQSLRAFLIISGLLFGIPFLGRMMNGFSYPSNRWSFAFAFLASYCVVEGMDTIFRLNRLQAGIVGVIVVLYNAVIIASNVDRIKWIIGPIGILDVFILFILFGKIIREGIALKWCCIVTTVLVCANIIINGHITFDADYAAIATEYARKDSVNTRIGETTKHFNFQEYDPGYYRIDSTNITNNNFSVFEKVSTPNVYNSVINSSTVEYLQSICALNGASNFCISGVDNRVQAESLLGVKYYVSTEETKQYLPYGATFIKEIGEGYSLYENPYAFPLVYSYETYMEEKDYDQLNAIDKQNIVLSTAVAEEIDGIDENVKKEETEKSPYIINEISGVEMRDDGKIVVTSADNYMELQVDKEKDTELYLELKGLDISSSGNQNISVQVEYQEISKTIFATAKDYAWHFENKDPWVNLGWQQGENDDTIRISFSSVGEYDLEEINLYQNDLKKLETVQHMNQDISNLQFGINVIECDVTFDKNKILNFNIPYSRNWTLYVDGKKQEFFKVNHYSIGGVIEAGEHEIKMVYHTPFLKIAIIGSAIGWLYFVCCFIMRRRKNHSVTKKKVEK